MLCVTFSVSCVSCVKDSVCHVLFRVSRFQRVCEVCAVFRVSRFQRVLSRVLCVTISVSGASWCV